MMTKENKYARMNNEELAMHIIGLVRGGGVFDDLNADGSGDKVRVNLRSRADEVLRKPDRHTSGWNTGEAKAAIALGVDDVNEAAFELFNRNVGLVKSFYRERSNYLNKYGMDVDDFCQQVFLNLVANIVKFDEGRSSFVGFLRAIMVNTAGTPIKSSEELVTNTEHVSEPERREKTYWLQKR